MATDVSDRELVRSFESLTRAVVKPDGTPGYLLRFYGVECGLKSAVMRRYKLRSTEQLQPELRSHDLVKLAKELHLAPNIYKETQACRRASMASGDNGPVQSKAVHEAWRYGARLDGDDEQKFVASLDSLATWCRAELRL